MQPAHRLGPQAGQVLVPVGEQPQHHHRVLHRDRSQPLVTQRRDGSGQRVVGVVLRPPARAEQADLRRQRRRDVDDILTGPDQLLSQQEPQPTRGLDRPPPVRERRSERQKLNDLPAARADREPRQLTLIAVDHHRRV